MRIGLELGNVVFHYNAHATLLNSVLIDDRKTLAADWVSKGGIFVHHVCTQQTLQQLRVHGILLDDEVEEISRPTKKGRVEV